MRHLTAEALGAWRNALRAGRINISVAFFTYDLEEITGRLVETTQRGVRVRVLADRETAAASDKTRRELRASRAGGGTNAELPGAGAFTGTPRTTAV